MRSRLASLVAILWLVTSLFPASVAAIPAAPGPESSVIADVQGPCIDGFGTYFHSQQEATTSSPSQSRSGVSATINTSNNDFDICSGNRTENDAISAYVSIEPKVPFGNNPEYQILQLGIVECIAFGYEACDGENNPRFFFAYGGCLNYPWNVPTPEDLGPANYGSHTYTMYLSTDNMWHLEIDGGAGNESPYLIPNTYIGCWGDGQVGGGRKAVWAVERHDRGDSIGSNGDVTFTTNMRFGVYNQGWFNPNFYAGVDGTCHHNDANGWCHIYDGDDMHNRTLN